MVAIMKVLVWNNVLLITSRCITTIRIATLTVGTGTHGEDMIVVSSATADTHAISIAYWGIIYGVA
jgi:hypothetical protein